jgi:hypothetical protein
MAKKLTYLASLQAKIRERHECEAIYRESVHVHETVDGQTVWKGDVEVFDLEGCPEARSCYIWLWEDKQRGPQYVMILEKPPVNSAEMAVKTAIYFDAQPAPYPGDTCFS